MASQSKSANAKTPAFSPETAKLRETDWAVVATTDFDAEHAYRLAGLESYIDAGQWAAAARNSGDATRRRSGAMQVVVVVDTVYATFQLEEIIHELRDFAVAIELSPWGYLFSYIKVFSDRPECVLPDRSDITMATHCLRSYARHVADVARRRHVQVLGEQPVDTELPFTGDTRVVAADLLQVPRGRITERGVRDNIRIVLRHITAVLDDTGGGESANVGSDTTLAELARAQLWQWVHHETGVLDSGHIITATLFETWLTEEVTQLAAQESVPGDDLEQAARLLDDLTRADKLAPFLPDEAYRRDH